MMPSDTCALCSAHCTAPLYRGTCAFVHVRHLCICAAFVQTVVQAFVQATHGSTWGMGGALALRPSSRAGRKSAGLGACRLLTFAALGALRCLSSDSHYVQICRQIQVCTLRRTLPYPQQYPQSFDAPVHCGRSASGSRSGSPPSETPRRHTEKYSNRGRT